MSARCPVPGLGLWPVRIAVPLWATLVAAGVGCLNPRPEEDPSRTGAPGDAVAAAGAGDTVEAGESGGSGGSGGTGSPPAADPEAEIPGTTDDGDSPDAGAPAPPGDAGLPDAGGGAAD